MPPTACREGVCTIVCGRCITFIHPLVIPIILAEKHTSLTIPWPESRKLLNADNVILDYYFELGIVSLHVSI
jgi:hypothetical protein